MLTDDSTYLTDLQQENWIWHHPCQGLNTFRKHSKYADLDLGIVQPIPLIFFDFITTFIKLKEKISN